MIDFALPHYDTWFSDLLDTLDDNLSTDSRQFIRDSYSSRTRVYHDMFHVAFLWHCYCELERDRLKEFNHTIRASDMALAIACHDVIYDPRSSTNEADSAAWCRNKGVCWEPAEWASSVIVATADHFAVREMRTDKDYARELVIGLDLIPLAAPLEIFQMDGLRIRAEYCHLSDVEWNAGRQAFLTKANCSTAIFQHPLLHEMFERPAKENIKRMLLRDVL